MSLPLRNPLSLALALAFALATPVRAAETGDQAPSFAARSLADSSTLSLASYRGKVVWVDFWASWCTPCLASLPALEKLRKEIPSEHFQILAVNVDREPEKARAFLAKHPVGFPSISDPEGRIPESFGLKTMPSSYLVDRDGVVRYVHRGYRAGDIDEIKREIQRLLEPRREAKK